MAIIVGNGGWRPSGKEVPKVVSLSRLFQKHGTIVVPERLIEIARNCGREWRYHAHHRDDIYGLAIMIAIEFAYAEAGVLLVFAKGRQVPPPVTAFVQGDASAAHCDDVAAEFTHHFMLLERLAPQRS